MGVRGFLSWLFSDAGAGWFFGFASLIGLAYSVWTKKKPKRIVCRETGRFSLVRIRKGALERIAVFFDGERVEKLTQLEAEIVNEGSEAITDAALEFNFPDGTRILHFSWDAEPKTLEVATHMIAGNQIRVKMPFLNPTRDHGDRVRVIAVCSGSVDGTTVAGGGEGWSVSFVALPPLEYLRKRVIATQICLLATVVASAALTVASGRFWGIDTNDASPQSFYLFVPFLLVCGLTMWASIRSSSRLTARLYG